MRNFTEFKCLLKTTGMHIDEACVFLNATNHTIRKYLSDNSRNSEWACLLLMDVIAIQSNIVNIMIDEYEHDYNSNLVKIRIPISDYEAQKNGLPTVSCYQPIVGQFMTCVKKYRNNAKFEFEFYGEEK